jgi:hypothetical protein
MIQSIPELTVLAGYYGVGKTNVALNMALSLAHQEMPVSLVDLDIVNPYFRSSDEASLLGEKNINLIAPNFAGSTMETPALPAAISGAILSPGHVVIDLGGDDAGATILGRYRKAITERIAHDEIQGDPIPFALWYVANRYRADAGLSNEEAALLSYQQLKEIETTVKLEATGIINNSHLQAETTTQLIKEGLVFARELARLSNLPIVDNLYPKELEAEVHSDPELAEAIQDGELVALELLSSTPWNK